MSFNIHEHICTTSIFGWWESTLYISVAQNGFFTGVSGVSRDKNVRAEVYHWQSSICTYQLKFVRQHSTLIISSLAARNQSLLQSRSFLIL
jgi:hypothetical protein